MSSLALTHALPTVLVLLKATAILIAALLLTLALQRSSASARHQVWLVALAGLLALPAIATFAPVGFKVLPAVVTAENTAGSRTDAINDREGAAVSGVTTGQDRPATQRSVGTTPAAPRPLSLGTLLLGAWAAVAAVLLGRLLLGMLAVRRIVGTATPLEDEMWQATLYEIADRLGIDDAPALLRSDRIAMPFAAGFRRPLIVLPASCDDWRTPQREAVLIHELGHVRRRDMVGHMLGRVACALYWFHPLVWTAARRLRDASERACDDLAIRLGAIPSDYAQHLLDIVTTVRQPNTPTAAIAMARRKEFEGRMLAILDPALHRGEPSRGRTALLSLSLAGFVVAVSAAAPAPREALPPTIANLPVAATVPPGADGEQPIESPGSSGQRTTPTPNPAAAPRPAAEPEPLNDALRIADRLLRQQNVQFTIDLGSTTAPADEKMDLLIRVLKTDSSASVRRVAAWGLEHYAGEAAAQAELARTLGSDDDPRVRKMAAWALAHGSGETVLAALRKAATSDGDADVLEMAIWGLGSNGDRASVGAITAALSNPASERLQGTAAWALGKVRPDRAPAALVALLGSPNNHARLTAAWALSEIGDSTTIPALQAALDRQSNDDDTTRALLRALIKCGIGPDDLTRFLSSSRPELRLFAIKAMTGGGGVDPWPWPWPRPIPMP